MIISMPDVRACAQSTRQNIKQLAVPLFSSFSSPFAVASFDSFRLRYFRFVSFCLLSFTFAFIVVVLFVTTSQPLRPVAQCVFSVFRVPLLGFFF